MFYTCFILFILYSIIGWLLEVLLSLYEHKRFINRGFLIGPYCPIYGAGSVLLTLLLSNHEDNIIVLFILSMVICAILEYFASYILEKIFKLRWWDYTDMKYNINGRICLETMIPFGIFGLIIMYKVNPFFLNILSKIPPVPIYIIASILIIPFLIDNYISSKAILEIQTINKNIQKKMLIKKDDTERITKLVREKIEKSTKILNRRIIHAFPHLQLLKRKNLLKRTKQKNTKRN